MALETKLSYIKCSDFKLDFSLPKLPWVTMCFDVSSKATIASIGFRAVDTSKNRRLVMNFRVMSA